MRRLQQHFGVSPTDWIAWIMVILIPSIIGFFGLLLFQSFFDIKLYVYTIFSFPFGILLIIAIVFLKYISAPKIEKKIRRVKRELKRSLNGKNLGKVSVDHFGATDIDPKSLYLCIQVEKDEVVAALKADLTMKVEIRCLFVQVGYPIEAINEIKIDTVSQETVDRDYRGSWWEYYKISPPAE